MPMEQCGGAEATVRTRVALVTDPNAPAIQKSNDRGDGTFFGQSALREVGFDALPDPRKGTAEVRAALKLYGISTRDESRMVAVLFASLVVDASGENMRLSVRREPSVRVGGRQGNPIQPLYLIAIGNPLALGAEIGPSSSDPATADARRIYISENEALCHGR